MEQRQDSQRSIIRTHLLAGKSITPIEALNLCGCFRLSAVIHILRHEEDLPILMEQPEAHEGKPYARYWIDHTYLAQHPDTAIHDEP